MLGVFDPTSLTSRVLFRTKDHKPDDPEERQRIEAKGGQIERERDDLV